jgi:hypothetical protein
MVKFDHDTMPPRQQMKHSLLSMLMTEARAKTSALLRFLYDKNDVLELRITTTTTTARTTTTYVYDNFFLF